MRFTDEQIEFFQEIEFGTGNIMFEAVAGSGKTTSIVSSLNYIDDAEPILACSFTKLAATQLDKKIRANDFTNINSTTLNSLGWKVCRSNVRGCELDTNKTWNILQAQLKRSGLKELDSDKVFRAMMGPIKRIIGLLKSYVVTPEEAYSRAQELANYHGVEFPEGNSNEAKYARESMFDRIVQVYKQSVNCLQFMDFDDQKFFPVWHGWSMPKYRKLYIDECQDCNVCDIELVKLLHRASPDARSIWVGDRMQAIYLFRGSLLNAMDDIQREFPSKLMTLSICWRCADDILLEPKEINPLIKSPTPNPKGKGIVKDITTAEFLENVRVGDYVICRTNAPLVKRCLQLVRAGKPAKVKGREVGRTLVGLINKVDEQAFGGKANRGSRETLLEFIEALSIYKVETVQMLEAAKKDEAATRVSDECESLEWFCMEAKSLDDVQNRIEAVFIDDEDDTKIVLLLTGHKSKGLERERVFFLRPDLCPFPKAKSEHEQECERRLRYVILTRAERERYHVQKERDEK